MRTLSAIVFMSTLVTGCVVGEDEDQISGGEDTEIIGGSTDYGDPAVAYIRSVTGFNAFTGAVTAWGNCTGTLIAPTVVLTAAHCFVPSALWTEVAFGTQPNLTAPRGTAGYVQGTIIRSALFNGNPVDGHDVAVVVLTRPVSIAPVPRGPTPAVGTNIKAIGYGLNQLDAKVGTGTKRHLVMAVTNVLQHEIQAGFEGNNVCNGDSGGPVVQNGRIVGISDYVDTVGCHGGGHFVRVDDNLPFIRTYVASF